MKGIWPIPHGISINSYLIKGEKNVLIDLTQDIMDFPKAITGQMEEVNLAVEDIDIIVINHMEPDHSSWLREFCKKNTKGVIYCTKKAVPLLEAFAGGPCGPGRGHNGRHDPGKSGTMNFSFLKRPISIGLKP